MPEEKRTTEKPSSAVRPVSQQKPATAVKPKKKMSGGALLSIVLVVAIAAVCAAVYFDLGGARTSLASALGMTTVQAAAQASSQAADAEQAELNEQKAALESQKNALKETEEALDTRESELNAREQDLAARESAVSDAEASAAQEAETASGLASVGQIIAKMDAKSAANAIADLDTVSDMVKVLTSMPSEQAALIMEKMDSSLVTEIVSHMVQ